MNEESAEDRESPLPQAGATHTPGHGWHWGFVILGVLMMAVSLGVSVAVSAAGSAQSGELYHGSRAFLAIGGALAAGGVLGFLHVDLKMWKNQAIRGGGGFGVFLILFFFNPSAEVSGTVVPDDRKDAASTIVAAMKTSPKDAAEVRSILRDAGFDSVREFKVTATDTQLRQVVRKINTR